MSHRIVIRHQAEVDITDAAVWYQRQQPVDESGSGLGDAFLAEVDAAISAAATNPKRFPRLRRQPEVRRALTRRFPYRIFFICRPDAIVIIRVLHAARDDRQWKDQADVAGGKDDSEGQ